MRTITIFSPLSIPHKTGAGVNAYNTALEFKKLNYRVVIISFKKGQHKIFESVNDIEIVRIPYPENKFLKLISYVYIIPLFLIYLLKTNEISLIYGPIQGYISLLFFGKIFRKKVIYRSTMFGQDDLISLNNKYGKYLYRIRKLMHKLMGGYFAQNLAMAESFKKEYKSSIKIFESAQGVNIEKFKSVSDKEKLELKKKLGINLKVKNIILSVGYVIERKGYREIFNSLSKFYDNDFLYVIIGKNKADKTDYLFNLGQEMKLLSEYAYRKLDKRVLFVGEKENVDDYLKISDLFILNSEQEGTPNVLLEAMSSSLFVICSKIEGVNNYITFDKHNCLVIDKNQSLEKSLEFYFNNKKNCKKIQDSARKLMVEKFNISSIAKNILQTFK